METGFAEPRFVNSPAFCVVGLETPFRCALSDDTNNASVIPALWDRVGPHLGALVDRAEDVTLGIVRTRPAEQRAHDDEMDYLAGAPVLPNARVPEGLVDWDIPAATYAAFELHGPIRGIDALVAHIFRTWLPASAFRHAGTPDVERYDERFDPASADSVMEYLVPVVPKVEAEA